MSPGATLTENCKTLKADSLDHDYDISSKGTFSYDFKWEGIVTNINESVITSRLIESNSSEEDVLEYPLSDIPEDDLELVEIGAIFNFYVGYSNSNGTVKNSDLIKFRRKKIDRSDIDDILDTMNQIGFDEVLEDY